MPLNKAQVANINSHNMLNRLDYFAEQNMIHIKVPNITNFNVSRADQLIEWTSPDLIVQAEPLQKYDEEQLYDEDFESILSDSHTMRGFSKWSDLLGNSEWKECVIESYNKSRRIFVIRWVSNGRRKEVSRINLLFEKEPTEKGDLRYQQAKEKR